MKISQRPDASSVSTRRERVAEIVSHQSARRHADFRTRTKALVVVSIISIMLSASWSNHERAEADERGHEQPDWMQEIEEIFIPSSQCKLCHDRHFEEWKGMRERTEDLKSFGRVDAALLHGNALKSPVFRTVLGLWLATDPTPEQRVQCLACHVPAVTLFPQHTDRIIEQVLAGPRNVKVEGIGCTSCHLIDSTQDKPESFPTFKLNPGNVMFGPYAGAEDNLVHPSEKADVYNGANYCTACHFSKVNDVTQPRLAGPIMDEMVCQDCHMEQSTGSSTSEHGRLSRPIGRHWFLGVVTPGTMLSHRNVQAEWSSRVDVEAEVTSESVTGTVHIRNGNLTHMFPGGDPTLKQFFLTVTVKDRAGHVIANDTRAYGQNFAELMRGPIPRPFINGGTSRHVPFHLTVGKGHEPALVEVSLNYSLIPQPSAELKSRYFDSLPSEKDRQKAEDIIAQYTSQRLLTFRTYELQPSTQRVHES